MKFSQDDLDLAIHHGIDVEEELQKFLLMKSII